MRFMYLFGAAAAVAIQACAPAIDVRTIVSPDARLSALRTFRVLPPPQPLAGEPLDAKHPMLNNSITNRALRFAIADNLESRGYVLMDTHPDFAVAVYAAFREKLQVTYWDYGYPWRPRWWRGWSRGRGEPLVTEFTEGTVIIDVIDATTKELLWRGRGVAIVEDDREYETQLRKTVKAIVDQFPRAQPPPVVAQRH